MIEKTYFSCEVNEDNCLIHWHEESLMGEMFAEIVKIELMDLIRERPSILVVLDFSNINSISSSVISTFLRIQQELNATGGKLRFGAVSSSLQQIFRTLNLHSTRFEIFETTELALDFLPPKLTANEQLAVEERES